MLNLKNKIWSSPHSTCEAAVRRETNRAGWSPGEGYGGPGPTYSKLWDKIARKNWLTVTRSVWVPLLRQLEAVLK